MFQKISRNNSPLYFKHATCNFLNIRIISIVALQHLQLLKNHFYHTTWNDPFYNSLNEEIKKFNSSQIACHEIDGRKILFIGDQHYSVKSLRIKLKLTQAASEAKCIYFREGNDPVPKNVLRYAIPHPLSNIEPKGYNFSLENRRFRFLCLILNLYEDSNSLLSNEMNAALTIASFPDMQDIWNALAASVPTENIASIAALTFNQLNNPDIPYSLGQKNLEILAHRSEKEWQNYLHQFSMHTLKRINKQTPLPSLITQAANQMLDRSDNGQLFKEIAWVNARNELFIEKILSKMEKLPKNLLITSIVGFRHIMGMNEILKNLCKKEGHKFLMPKEWIPTLHNWHSRLI